MMIDSQVLTTRVHYVVCDECGVNGPRSLSRTSAESLVYQAQWRTILGPWGWSEGEWGYFKHEFCPYCLAQDEASTPKEME